MKQEVIKTEELFTLNTTTSFTEAPSGTSSFFTTTQYRFPTEALGTNPFSHELPPAR